MSRPNIPCKPRQGNNNGLKRSMILFIYFTIEMLKNQTARINGLWPMRNTQRTKSYFKSS